MSIYAFLGNIKSDVVDESSETACLRASLSVQDLLSVGGASGREGLQRTAPRWEKLERPLRGAGAFSSRLRVSGEIDDTVGGGLVQGVASSWADIVSSMLASPQGASEQYIWTLTFERMANGCCSCSVCSISSLLRIQSDVGYGGVDSKRHWSSRKRLNARMARTSACQSCKTLPSANGSLLCGRHFMPVLRLVSRIL